MLICQYPGCRTAAAKTWALVMLCEGHHEAIREESASFYAPKSKQKGTEKKQRKKYLQIAPQIPWSKMNLKAGDWA